MLTFNFFFNHKKQDSQGIRFKTIWKAYETRTAWAVFKYCGTKTAPLRRNFF